MDTFFRISNMIEIHMYGYIGISMEVAPNHQIHFSRIFPHKPSSFWGTGYLRKAPWAEAATYRHRCGRGAETLGDLLEP